MKRAITTRHIWSIDVNSKICVFYTSKVKMLPRQIQPAGIVTLHNIDTRNKRKNHVLEYKRERKKWVGERLMYVERERELESLCVRE